MGASRCSPGNPEHLLPSVRRQQSLHFLRYPKSDGFSLAPVAKTVSHGRYLPAGFSACYTIPRFPRRLRVLFPRVVPNRDFPTGTQLVSKPFPACYQTGPERTHPLQDFFLWQPGTASGCAPSLRRLCIATVLCDNHEKRISQDLLTRPIASLQADRFSCKRADGDRGPAYRPSASISSKPPTQYHISLKTNTKTTVKGWQTPQNQYPNYRGFW